MGLLTTIRGRDMPWPGWAEGTSVRNPFSCDSLVVNGTGISALTFAGRAARSASFRGKTTLADSPVEESRRLIDGVTLRARSIDYYAASMGVSRERVLSEIYGPDWRAAETDRQIAAFCRGSVSQGFEVVKRDIFMCSGKHRHARSTGIPLAYGVRNSRLRAALHKLALEAGAEWIAEKTNSFHTLKSFAQGTTPLIVNGTTKSLADALMKTMPPRPTRYVAAAQLAFSAPHIEKKGILHRHTSLCTWVYREGAIDMGVYYPFQDPLSPTAAFYGIFYRVVRADEAKEKKEDLKKQMYGTVSGVGAALGLEPVDPGETTGSAVVPATPWKNIENSQHGVLDLSRIAGSGTPVITGDGMTRAGLAGLVGAESLLAGRDPATDIKTALKLYRRLNHELYLGMTVFARPAAWLMRLAPRLAFARQSQSYYRDMWAGAY